MVFFVGDLVCTVLVLVGLVVLLFMLLVPLVAEHRRGDKGSKAKAIAVTVVLMAGLLGYSAWLYADYRDWMDTKELEYALNITVDGNASGVIYVPVSENLDMQDALEVSNNGTISLVGLARGQALRVEYRGNVTVRGRVVTKGELVPYELTMLDDGKAKAARFYWVKLEAGENASVKLDLMLEHHSVYLDEWFWTSETVDAGWTSVDFHQERQEWYYG